MSQKEWNKCLEILNASVSTSTSSMQPSYDVNITTRNTTASIGKVDISVNTTVTNAGNTNQLTVGINVSTTTHYDAYIFYLPEWESQMKDDKENIESYYGIDKDDIGTASVNSSDELANSWNSIGSTDSGNVSLVVINTHAKKDKLSLGNGNMYSNDITSLENKNIDKLILYGCNAGHLDNVNDNPAANFSKKVNGGLVLASDGTVYGGTPPILWMLGYSVFTSKGDESFNNQRASGSNRDNQGWLLYQYQAGSIVTSGSLGYEFSLTEMIDSMK